jgi:hypothetical protein
MRRPGCFTSGKDPVTIVQGAGSLQGLSGRMREISPSQGFDPRTVQAVASRYIDWAIAARLNLGMVLQSGTRPFPFVPFPVRTHQSRHSASCVCVIDRASTVSKYTTLKGELRDTTTITVTQNVSSTPLPKFYASHLTTIILYSWTLYSTLLFFWPCITV